MVVKSCSPNALGGRKKQGIITNQRCKVFLNSSCFKHNILIANRFIDNLLNKLNWNFYYLVISITSFSIGATTINSVPATCSLAVSRLFNTFFFQKIEGFF